MATSAARSLLCSTLALSLGFAALPARRAEAAPTSAEIAAARELFTAGLKDEDAGDWHAALDKFRKVIGVKETAAVRFHVALCLEKLNQLVDALDSFERAQAEATDGSAASQTVATNSANHISKLHERIPRIVIQLPEGASNPTISIDGATLSSSLAGTEIPLDPGDHDVIVRADGKRDFEQKVTLVERAPAATTIAVTFEPASAAAPAIPVVGHDHAQHKDVPPAAKGTHGSALPYVIAGVGVASLIGAGVMYGLRAGTISDLDTACGGDRSRCPAAKSDVADKGKTYTTLGNVFLGVGVVALASALVIAVASPSAQHEPTSASRSTWTLSSGPAPLGVGLAAAF